MKNSLTFLFLCFSVIAFAQAPSFAPFTNYGVGISPVGIAQADFTRDGKPDLAVAYMNDTGTGGITVLQNNGSGGFSTVTTIIVTAPPAGNLPEEIVAADFDNDGDIDIIATMRTFIVVATNNGTATSFTTSFISVGSSNNMHITVGNFNADSKPDIAITDPYKTTTNRLIVMLNTSTTSSITFGSPSYYVIGNFPTCVKTADMNNDGKMDIITANSSSSNISILLGTGTGTFNAAVNTALSVNGLTALAIGDFNNDSYKDVMATYDYSVGYVKFLKGNANGTLTAMSTITVAPSGPSRDILCGDFNNDAKLDIACVSVYNTTVKVVTGNNDGTFSSSYSFPVNNTQMNVASGDFNGDGKLDLATTIQASGTGYASVLLNNYLLPEPTVAASNITFSSITPTSLRIQWTSGNGSGRIVVIKQGSAVDQSPVDAKTYLASTTLNTAPELVSGSGDKVVYAGPNSFADLSHLLPGTLYYFSIFEYNGSGRYDPNGLPSLINYKITGAPTAFTTTTSENTPVGSTITNPIVIDGTITAECFEDIENVNSLNGNFTNNYGGSDNDVYYKINTGGAYFGVYSCASSVSTKLYLFDANHNQITPNDYRSNCEFYNSFAPPTVYYVLMEGNGNLRMHIGSYTYSDCADGYTMNSVTSSLAESIALVKTSSVYPNPANSVATVDLSDTKDSTLKKVVVVNKYSKVVKYFETTDSQLQIMIADLPADTYIIKIYSTKGNSNLKLMVN